MLSDANPMVVANAIAALQEVQEVSGKEVLQITSHTLFKLLAALNECTEWGQVGGWGARWWCGVFVCVFGGV
jgi:AP-1 complex subunit beta-1